MQWLMLMKRETLIKLKIIKGLGGGCDEEVVRVLQFSKFKPGQHEGKPVKVKTTVSVVFKLK
jgi:protein TonB